MFFISFFTLSLCSLQFHVDLIKDEVITYHPQSSGLELFTEMLFTAFLDVFDVCGQTGLAVIKQVVFIVDPCSLNLIKMRKNLVQADWVCAHFLPIRCAYV